jgi:DNA modification methylase
MTAVLDEASHPVETPITYDFPMPDKNTLFYGDNLDVLPRIASESVDLIYLDPPFKSDRQYNVLFRTVKGDPASAQIHAFDDTWSWSIEAETTYQTFTAAPATSSELVTFLRAMFQVLGKSDMMAYLVMMAPRLVEMKRVLKQSGSIYLHCDPTSSHYLKLLMDSVFGVGHFQNEIIWQYSVGGRGKKHFARKHDVIFFYSKTDEFIFNEKDVRIPMDAGTKSFGGRLEEDEDGRKYRLVWGTGRKKLYKYYLDEGKLPEDVWPIQSIQSQDAERLGYPTQKPLALLDRIIKASSPPGGVVLDPFCGCGTAVDAAQALDRKWVGIDIAYIAIDLIRNRLIGRYGKDVRSTFGLDGIPQDNEGADALANSNKIDFERWAVSMVNGQPTKASGDEGIDGKVYFARSYKEPIDVGTCVVSVKAGGSLNPGMVRDLAGTVSGSGNQMGLLITRVQPTAGMVQEAQKHGSYIHEATGTIYPLIQLMMTDQLLTGDQPKIPSPLPPYQQASWAAASVAVPLF